MMTDAVLPWAPLSCKRIWEKARKDGLSEDAALALMVRAEQKTLARDAVSL